MDRLKHFKTKLILKKEKEMSRQPPVPILEPILEHRSSRKTQEFNSRMSGKSSSRSTRILHTPPGAWSSPRDDAVYSYSSLSSLPSLQNPPNPPSPKQDKSQFQPPPLQKSPYGDVKLPLFGPQYGMSVVSVHQQPPAVTTIVQAQSFNPYEEMMRQADADMQRAFAESLQTNEVIEGSTNEPNPDSSQHHMPPVFESSSKLNAQSELPSTPEPELEPPFVIRKGHPTSCVVCTEDFCDTIRPPAWITLACDHHPGVCRDCLAQSIASDLDNKIWNEITCPESGCDAQLIYEDIQRLADPQTFARYEVLSFRNAVSKDQNFVWCQKCPFGQLHSPGASQPVVHCLSCDFRSCFRHSIPWHTHLTCEEYDKFLSDPDNFTYQDGMDDEAASSPREQEEEQKDERLARKRKRDRIRQEEERQRLKHEEEIGRARAEQETKAQEAKAAKKREAEREAEREAQRQAEILAEEKREAEREAQRQAEREAQRQAEILAEKQAQKLKEMEEMKQRMKDDAASLAKVDATTKKCPGCKWPIEKNNGCAHMTCLKCKHQFCWNCLLKWSGHSRCT